MEGSVARIEAWLRARDAARFQEDMRKSGREVRDLGRSGRVASAGLSMMRSSARSAADWLGAAGRAARYMSVGIGVLGAGAIKMGLDFNSSMEQNTVAFKHFLGSTDAATSYLRRLYQLAATTPFEFAPLTTATKRMIAFGFSAENALSTLRIIGDAVSGLGTGQEGIDRMVIAFGQIKASGVLRGQDLLQLQQAGISTTKYLKQAGLATSGDVGKIGMLHISASKGIKAIIDGMKRDFGGLSAAQAKTWKGLVSTIHDYTAQMMGDITKPLFDIGKRRVLPAVRDLTQDMSAIWKQQKPLEWKLEKSQAAVEKHLGPLFRDIKRWWTDHHVNDWLSKAFSDVLKKLAELAAASVPKIIGVFINAWLASGLWGKLFLTSWLLKKMGAFKVAGDVAATWFKRRFGYTAAAELPATVDGLAGSSRLKGRLATFGRWMGRAVGVAAAVAIGIEVANYLQNKFGSAFSDLLSGPTEAGIAADRNPDVRHVRKSFPSYNKWSTKLARKYNLPNSGLGDIIGTGTSAKELAWLFRAGDPSLTPDAKKQAQNYLKRHPGKVKISPHLPGLRTGGLIQQAGWGWVGEDGPELRYMPTGTQVMPFKGARVKRGRTMKPITPELMEGVGSRTIIVPVKLNGREIARVVAHDTDDELARR